METPDRRRLAPVSGEVAGFMRRRFFQLLLRRGPGTQLFRAFVPHPWPVVRDPVCRWPRPPGSDAFPLTSGLAWNHATLLREAHVNPPEPVIPPVALRVLVDQDLVRVRRRSSGAVGDPQPQRLDKTMNAPNGRILFYRKALLRLVWSLPGLASRRLPARSGAAAEVLRRIRLFFGCDWRRSGLRVGFGVLFDGRRGAAPGGQVSLAQGFQPWIVARGAAPRPSKQELHDHLWPERRTSHTSPAPRRERAAEGPPATTRRNPGGSDGPRLRLRLQDAHRGERGGPSRRTPSSPSASCGEDA
jgi:hypothetical protein